MVITRVIPTQGCSEAQGRLSLEAQMFPSGRFFITIEKGLINVEI